MADVHHHDTYVEDRQGPATVLGVLAVAALIGFLVWLFAFSGIVFDRNNNDGGGTTNIEIEQRDQPDQPPPVDQPT